MVHPASPEALAVGEYRGGRPHRGTKSDPVLILSNLTDRWDLSFPALEPDHSERSSFRHGGQLRYLIRNGTKRGDQTMSGDNAEAARKGLLHSAAGKAKEVAGAILNNDSLAKEGRLQQAEAQASKQAGTAEAVAEVRSEQAVEELGQVHEQARENRRMAAEEADAAREQAERDRRRERAQADDLAERRRRAGQAMAHERTADEIHGAVGDTRSEILDVDQEEAQALERQRRAQQVAAAEEQAARRERATASRLDSTTGEGTAR
ncbi:MAG TPA: CsbD family protein [Pseudonocardia sp.]|nr:CsbD family protein [Pseudonocardia sp.]